MKYKKYLMGFLFVFSILFTTIVGTSNVLADTTSYSGAYNYDNTGNKQYRFITIVKSTQWTGNHYVSGQPTKGTYLKNGDMLYYSESGGPNYSLSVGVGYKIGSVSLGIPLGKISNGTFGIGVRATGKGYYKLALNKQVKPTIMLIQYRTKQYGKWSSWGEPSVYSKKYQTVRIKPALIKQ